MATEDLLARDTIHASEKPLLKVFCDDYAFRIPAYQRPYSWDDEQVGQLLDDLVGAIDSDDPATNTPYFLGSIVLIKHPDKREADVVDGQQRLTTLTIMFAVLRDLAAKDRSKKVHKYICQEGDPFAGAKDQFRLTLRPRDAEFFEKWVQKEGATQTGPGDVELSDSQENMIGNTHFLLDQLAAMSEPQRDKLTAFMIQRCFLVVVEASNRKSAYRIFSVMNDRGLDLSPTDILKADVIGALPEAQREDYTEKWEDLEELLGRANFENLFGHIRMIHRRQKMRGTLEEEFRQFVAPEKRPAAFIDDQLEPMAEAYLAIADRKYSGTSHVDQINRRLKHLGRLDNMDWEAPAVLFMSKNSGSSDKILKFLTDLDRLAYGQFIWRANVNERVLRYGRLIKAIEDGDDLYAAKSSLQLSKDEIAKFSAELDGNVYEMTRIRLPLLLRLDEAISSGGADYDLKIITVEHVLPQNPKKDSNWLKHFKSDDVRSKWVHRLANLTLLDRRKNTSAGNFDFDDKKSKYFLVKGSTPFAITSQVNAEKKWTPDVLERRQEALLDTLKELWRL